jgi:hypothetical protein
MDYDEAIRRSIPFLRKLEKAFGLPLKSAAQSSRALKSRQNKLRNNPQETHGAPRIKTPRQTKLTHRSRSH